MKYINLTPHVVRLNNGTVFLESNNVARIKDIADSDGNIIKREMGIPPCVKGILYIVSKTFRVNSKRRDLVCPCTRSQLAVRRDGVLYSVPYLK